MLSRRRKQAAAGGIAASFAIVLGFLGVQSLTNEAVATVVPGDPDTCEATDLGTSVLVEWTPPLDNGGDAITNYTIKIKGQSTPVKRTDTNDPDGDGPRDIEGGDARSFVWYPTYSAWSDTTVFQVRAVNSAGFGIWCETDPLGGPTSPPTTEPTSAPTTEPTSAPTTVPTTQPTSTGGCFDYQASAYLCSSPGSIDPAKTSAMRSFMNTFVDQKGISYPKLNGLGTNQWGMVHADGKSTDPMWHLSPASALPTAVAAKIGPAGPGFHAPKDLGRRITGSSDSPGVVIDDVSGYSIWFAKAVKQSSDCTAANCTLTIGAGGFFQHGTNGLDSKSIGGFSNCPDLNKVCTVSRGRIPEAFLITAAEFAKAKAADTGVGHVLEFFWPETDDSDCLMPMSGCEGGNSGWGFEGQRVALDPSLNIVGRAGCSDDADVLVRTLQQNGAYIGDNSGSSAVLKMEQNSAADPVSSGAFSTLSQNELSGCVTWNDWVATGNGSFK